MLGTQEVHRGRQEVHRMQTGSSQGADRKSISTRQEVYNEQIEVHKSTAGRQEQVLPPSLKSDL